MGLLRSMLGRKMIMAVTGLAMSLYVMIHLIGNLSFFSGPDSINAYARMLHSLGPLLWTVRTVMAAALLFHMFLGIQITLENRTAAADKYALSRQTNATFAGKFMIWSGLAIAIYLGYHLLHFTIQVIYPEISAGRNPDHFGQPDVFSMVLKNFRAAPISAFYIVSMAAVGLHLSHGLQSMVQTLGLNSERTLPANIKISLAIGLVLFIIYASIPAGVVAGLAVR